MPAPIEVTVTVDSVDIDARALARHMNSPNGPVTRHLFQLGDQIKAAMIRHAPISEHDPIPRRRPITPGRLRDSIVKRVDSDGRGVFVRIGSVRVPYAMYVHEGTVPHGISPKKAGGFLVFASGGRTIYARHVNHPGNQPDRFAIRAAIEVLGGSRVRPA